MEEDLTKVNPDVYEPICVTLKLKVLVDPPLSIVEEKKEEDNIFVNFVNVIKENIPFREKVKKIIGIDSPRETKDVKINIVSASPKKIFDFFNLTMRKIQEQEEELKTERIYSDDYMFRSYVDSLASMMELVAHEDEVIRLVLDDKDNNIDFIPNLTVRQRIAIVEAFYKVNPVLDESRKKAKGMREEVEKDLIQEMKDSILKELEGIDMELLEKQLEGSNLESSPNV